MRSSQLHEIFYEERERLKEQVAQNLSRNIGSMVGHKDTSDVLLVSADGYKLPAHLCILRRSAVFFQRYVEPTLKARPTNQLPLEVAVGDVDFNGLSFFVRSIYTDEEIGELPTDHARTLINGRKDGGEGPSSGGRNASNRSKKGFRDGLRDDLNDNRPNTQRENFGNDSLNNSNTGSQNQLRDMTNRFDMYASFPSPGELQKRLIETDLSSQSTSNLNLQAPQMTSFREIANSQASLAMSTDSPMCMSISSEIEDNRRRTKSVTSDFNGVCMSKFIRLDDSVVSTGSQSSSARSESRNAEPKSIFPMFFGVGSHDRFDNDDDAMSQSVPPANDANSIRSRAILARRLSVSSLNSLTSIDLTPTHEGPPPIGDKTPINQLGADLLQMYQNQIDSDIKVIVNDGELRAHRVILWATCPAFRVQLSKKQKSIRLDKYTKSTVNFLMMFLYGGLTCVSDEVDCFELITLADELQLDTLMQVVLLNFRTYRCHFFHRPCATCVSSILDVLPQFQSNPALRPLYEEAMSWQAKHFARIWKGRIFLHMNEQWQKACFDALIQDITESSVIDVLLGCEKLQVALPRIKAQHSSQFVQRLVNDIVEFSTEFLITAFDGVISSRAFAQQGKGLALNLSLIEDIFPTLVHSLNADTAIRSFICLKNLLLEILTEQKQNTGSQRSLGGSSLSIHQTDEYNPRFFNLCKRLYELTDKHLLHYAASVVQSESWPLLTTNEQNRIQESGIFVEMRLPKAPPPKFSSFNRAYKRSSSVGFQQSMNNNYERTRSLERARPVATFTQLLEAEEPLEVIMEREKSQTHIQVNKHRRSASMRENSTSKITLRNEISKIPAKSPSKRNANSEVRTQTASPVNRGKKEEVPETKASPKKRSTKRPKHPPSTQQTRQPPPVPESVKLERELTQTIMSVQEIKERGINPVKNGLPEILPLKQVESNLSPSPAATLTLSSETLTHSPTPTVISNNNDSSKAKPRSVVKPMPKPITHSSASTQRAVIKTNVLTRKPTTAPNTSTAEENRLVRPIRSALPTRKTSPNRGVSSKTSTPLSIDEKPRRTNTTRTKIPHSSPLEEMSTPIQDDLNTGIYPESYYEYPTSPISFASTQSSTHLSPTQDDDTIISDPLNNRRTEIEELEQRLDAMMAERVQQAIELQRLREAFNEQMPMLHYNLLPPATKALKFIGITYWAFFVVRFICLADLNLLICLLGSVSLICLTFAFATEQCMFFWPFAFICILEFINAMMQILIIVIQAYRSKKNIVKFMNMMLEREDLFGNSLLDEMQSWSGIFLVEIYAAVKLLLFALAFIISTQVARIFFEKEKILHEQEVNMEMHHQQMITIMHRLELLRR